MLLGFVPLLGIALAAPAAALPMRTSSAADTVRELESRGYDVQINSNDSVPLRNCRASGIHGLNDSKIDDNGFRTDPTYHTTVYVDVTCQPDG